MGILNFEEEEEFTAKARRSLRGRDIGYLLLVIGGEKMSAVNCQLSLGKRKKKLHLHGSAGWLTPHVKNKPMRCSR
jgi:hypothetical protein